MTKELELHEDATTSSIVLLFAAPLMGAAAGAMGWGIRGQYGHGWGAMVPGVLVAFTLVFLFCKQSTSLHAARAVALTAIAFAFGGIMTYGQTVGLTHDTPLVGNHAAYRWGMVGLFIKGGLWVGFGGAFLGMELSEKKYGWAEMLKLYAVLLVFVLIGIQLFNRPYVPGTDRELSWFYFPASTPGERALPWLYFSDHWDWEPNKQDIDPRPELWGGLLGAFAVLLIYVAWFKKDWLALNMALIGTLGGGLGFTLGQSLQALNAWQPGWLGDFDRELHGWWPGIFPEEFFSAMHWNWWNMMETTFGGVMGFVLGLGLWLNRKKIPHAPMKDHVAFHPVVEWILIPIYVCLIYLWSVPRHDSIDWMSNFPLAMGLMPAVCILGGRYWPYLASLPFVALPIAGITLKVTAKVHGYTDQLLLLVLPMVVMTLAALYFEKRGRSGQSGRTYARYGLALSALVYYSLNFAVFGYPWATLPVGARHTNNWIFLRCTELLILGALLLHRRDPRIEVRTDAVDSE